MASEQRHIIIIGAGMGGLALAQSLRRQGIPFTIFERDAAAEARFQGWALSLHAWMMKDLIDNTIPNQRHDLQFVCNTSSLGIESEFAGYDLDTSKQTMRIGASTGSNFIRADRAKLREWLLTGLDIQWGKRFVRYEEDADGVTAHFDDGSSCRGDVLVGADGISSRIRTQLLGSDIQPKHLPMGVIVGQLTATRSQYERWMKSVAPSFYLATSSERKCRLFIGLKGIADDLQSAEYYWLYGWPDEAASYDGFWTTTAGREQLHSFVMKQINGLDELLTEPIRATQVDGMLMPPLLMRDMIPPALPNGRVTLVGDAVHPMVPFRGEGANQAMKDGFVLANMLVEAESDTQMGAILKKFEGEMMERTTKSVLASRSAGFV